MRPKSITIIPRTDTLENWNKTDYILKNKEICIVKLKNNKVKYKIGDGKSPFKKLRYVKKISDITECFTYCVLPLADKENEYVRLVSQIIFNPLERKEEYIERIKQVSIDDHQMMKNTLKYVYKDNSIIPDLNESSEELPAEPLEK